MHLTELEGVILGIISSREPCSTYAVRQRFERSPTWGWSTSKGAVYPAVARLVAHGFVTTVRSEEGRRRSELLSVSELGRQALQRWLLMIVPEMGSAPVDPIRARVSYLANLKPEQRRKFLDDAAAATRTALQVARNAIPDPEAKDAWALEVSYLGVQMQIIAKIEWLKKVRALALQDDA
jgi:DNA-binding PadR family transcriptional regulator